jgi:hypothetical protein
MAIPAPSERLRQPDDLNAPQTQIVADRDAYLGQGRNDVGRRIADDQVELFVAGIVAQSLQQEFSRTRPSSSRCTTWAPVLRCVCWAAWPTPPARACSAFRCAAKGMAWRWRCCSSSKCRWPTARRCVSTPPTSAPKAARAPTVARVLLAHSRLGVLMVGELPSHSLAAQLNPLQRRLLRGPWPNRDLLMVPLGSGIALASQGLATGPAQPVAVT